MSVTKSIANELEAAMRDNQVKSFDHIPITSWDAATKQDVPVRKVRSGRRWQQNRAEVGGKVVRIH